jgi:hypothetical protein
MASDPLGRMTTVRYNGGSVRAPLANINFLFGDVPVNWSALSAFGGGGARRPYGYRRATNAAAGEPVTVTFSTGEVATYRVTGTIKRFIQEVLARTSGLKITSVVSQRGSEWAPGAVLVPGD